MSTTGSATPSARRARTAATPADQGAPRTLADQLRRWPDADLATLLNLRPDLAVPAPQDSAQLASRAATRASVARAVDRLSLLELAVLEAVPAGGTASVTALRSRVHAARDRVDEAVARLRSLLLLWGTDEALRPTSVLAEVLGTGVTGLGGGVAELLGGYGPQRVATLARWLGLEPSGDRHADIEAVAAHLADTGHVAGLAADVDDRARAILAHLEQTGLPGSVASTALPDDLPDRPEPAAPLEPVHQLLARGLLVARDRTHVVVPREVAIGLRGGRTTRDPVDAVPEVATSERDTAMVDRAAAGAASEAVRQLELLLDSWGTAPPNALRTGGLGVRDLKAAAELMHVEPPTAALLVELAAAAGLVAVGATEDRDAAWLPTDDFDLWVGLDPADRWARLCVTWLDLDRLVGLVGGRVQGKPVNALAPDLERSWLGETRRAVLVELAGLPPGQVLAAGTGLPSLVGRLDWRRPRRPRSRDEAIGWVVAEAAALGVTGLGGMAAHGRALLEDDPAHATAAALAPALPDPVDHVLLQADLTAVAPGPLEQRLAHDLALLADVESRGGATVYRFSAGSVRRAFDSGWSVQEVHDFLTGASRTPVPQALDYLVDDVSRRFGTLRAGAAAAFLRSDDEAALAGLVHHPKAGPLRLRRIAPTVVVSDVSLDVLLPRLRELGAAPVVEAPDGTVRLARREVLRTRSPRRRGPEAPGAARDARSEARTAARTAAAVTAVRAGDRAAASRPATPSGTGDGPSARSTPASTMAVLREAVESGGSLWIGYVDNDGASQERVVEPVSVEGGWLSAYDHRTEDVRSFAVHRISRAHPVEASPDRPRRAGGAGRRS